MLETLRGFPLHLALMSYPSCGGPYSVLPATPALWAHLTHSSSSCSLREPPPSLTTAHTASAMRAFLLCSLSLEQPLSLLLLLFQRPSPQTSVWLTSPISGQMSPSQWASPAGPVSAALHLPSISVTASSPTSSFFTTQTHSSGKCPASEDHLATKT